MHITKNLEDLKSRIHAACEQAGRSESEVAILAVSKQHGADAVAAAAGAGLRRFGENYVQEALEKIPLCDPSLEWHFIGRIQSNKTRLIAENFDWVQTVASIQIAERLARQRPATKSPLNVCVQVDAEGDGAHGGIPAAEVLVLCRYIKTLDRLRLRGLMTIPQATSNRDEQRATFRLIRGIYDELLSEGFKLDTLSMGMTADLEAAVLEGSTMVRIGTALFGPRKN